MFINSPLDVYRQVREQTERLAAPLSAEDQTVQSMPDSSPTKWHLAHTTWFFETFVLVPHLSGYKHWDASYHVLFNSYYNSVGRPFPRFRRGCLTRPGVSEVAEYRRAVDEKMCLLLEEPSQEVMRLTELGLHHEQQHQELILTDIQHLLSLNPLDPVYWPQAEPEPSSVELERALGSSAPKRPSLEFVQFEGGVHRVGADDSAFHFDNEGPSHRVLLADFELAHRAITNAEVFAFIEAGGYEEPLLWLSDGWYFRQSHELKHPFYWRQEADDSYSSFTLHGRRPVEPSAPACHLSYFEADAIARFMGARLPTEQEWEVAANSSPGVKAPFEFGALRPRPSIVSAGAERPPCLQHVLGGVWEWTQSPYVPYPGYQTESGAVGEYNGKFMHNQMVLRGGSCVTPNDHVRVSYRNFFPSSAQWQFSGARLARGTNQP